MAREYKGEVPSDISALLPEKQKELVAVGNSVYEMLPLTEGMVERLNDDISRISKRFTEAQERRAKNDPTAPSFIDVILGDSGLKRIVATLLDVTEKEVATMTPIQFAHFAGVLYKQNFDLSMLSEGSRANFRKAGETLGLVQPAQTTADKMLDKIEEGFQIAFRMTQYAEAIPKEVILDILSGSHSLLKSTAISVPPTDGPANTSKESGESSAISLGSVAVGQGVEIVSDKGKTVTRMTREAMLEARNAAISVKNSVSNAKGEPV